MKNDTLMFTIIAIPVLALMLRVSKPATPKPIVEWTFSGEYIDYLYGWNEQGAYTVWYRASVTNTSLTDKITKTISFYYKNESAGTDWHKHATTRSVTLEPGETASIEMPPLPEYMTVYPNEVWHMYLEDEDGYVSNVLEGGFFS